MKKNKKEPLIVGQKVYLETTHKFGCDVHYESEPNEMIVLEANKTSAYIWWNNDNQQPSRVRFKVNQKNHQVKYPIPDGRSYRLWMSKEEYIENMEYEKELKLLREEAHKKVNDMTIEELRLFLRRK